MQQPHIETNKEVSSLLPNGAGQFGAVDLNYIKNNNNQKRCCVRVSDESVCPFYCQACNIEMEYSIFYIFTCESLQKLPEASSSATSEIAGTSISDDQEDKDGDKDSKKKKNRCGICRKKVGLTGKYTNDIFLYWKLHRTDFPHN